MAVKVGDELVLEELEVAPEASVAVMRTTSLEDERVMGQVRRVARVAPAITSDAVGAGRTPQSSALLVPRTATALRVTLRGMVRRWASSAGRERDSRCQNDTVTSRGVAGDRHLELGRPGASVHCQSLNCSQQRGPEDKGSPSDCLRL